MKSWSVYQEIIEHNYMFHREIIEAVKQQLASSQNQNPITVLDLGCGDASMALPLLKNLTIQNYIGCDLSQPALDIAHQGLCAAHIPHQCICNDMLNVVAEQPNETIDLVLSSYALHHLNTAQKEQIIRDVSRVLKPGGNFVLIDIFREPEEDRSSYMHGYMTHLHSTWSNLSSESQRLVTEHATNYDFPETTAFYSTQWQMEDLATGSRLAKHTWHEAWLYVKSPHV